MKAVGYQQSLAIEEVEALLDIELPEPFPEARDILVEVHAVAVNPVDTKIRMRAQPAEGEFKVLGYDATGIVKAVGHEVSSFKPGDEVWYSGVMTRQGSNAERQLVDERSVGHKPKTLDFAAAAALPLTGITAWEMLFDRLQLSTEGDSEKSVLLVTGAAGGVGSIMIQLARKLTKATVIGTASRDKSKQWVLDMGAHYVLDHSRSLKDELEKAGIKGVTHVASLTHTDDHFADLVEALLPQGKFALIDDPQQPLDIRSMKQKSLSLHWEFMFTRPMFQTDDMARQQQILESLAGLVDAGELKSTMGEHFGQISADNLKRAHASIEAGKSIGKIVLEGFPG